MTSTHKFTSAELLYKAAQEMGLRPSWVKPKSTFAIMVGGTERYIHEARSTLNSHVATSLIVDKHLTRLVLERRNMPNIPFAHVTEFADAAAFLKTHKKIIVKPTRGLGAIDIHIVTEAEELKAFNLSKYILEKYIAGREMRYLVINNKVVAVHESRYGVSVQADRALERISFPEDEWDPMLCDLTLEITRLFRLSFGIVDYMVDADGRAYVLELNTAPGLKWFHTPTSGPPVNVAQLFLESVIGEDTTLASDEDTTLAAMPILAYS